MNTEQLENILNTEGQTEGAVAVPTGEVTTTETPKRIYTKKEDMQRGNEAILATLSTEGDGLKKAQILAALSAEDRALVEHNWNLRIALLEETEQVRTQGNKVAKRYWRAA
jgi:hypothetical protein